MEKNSLRNGVEENKNFLKGIQCINREYYHDYLYYGNRSYGYHNGKVVKCAKWSEVVKRLQEIATWKTGETLW